jgi:cytochrome P450
VTATTADDPPLSLYHLLDPEVLADPYPLYRRLREEAPVQWDPYLHAWVVTRYEDVSTVLLRYRAARTPDPARLALLDMEELAPIAAVMVRQMLFLDPPEHRRVRKLASAAFTPRRIAHLREHIRQIAHDLVAEQAGSGRFDVMATIANPLPAIVTAEMLGVPTADHELLKDWSQDFAEMLGNFQHNPGRARKTLASVEGMVDYFREAVRREGSYPTEGLINALTTAEDDGDRFTEDEVIANVIVTMVGGQETTTNLIGNGLLTLLRRPEAMAELRTAPELMESAVEELLRFESPSQHTARLAPADAVLGGREIAEGTAVIAVMGAGNRDPERFPDPDTVQLDRPDNRHLAFGWASHFCFGAPLARMEGQIAFETLLAAFPRLQLAQESIQWRPNLGLRGLTELHVDTA